MTRLEGIAWMIAYGILSLYLAHAADNAMSGMDWFAYVVMAVLCLAYCLYYMVRVFDSRRKYYR